MNRSSRERSSNNNNNNDDDDDTVKRVIVPTVCKQKHKEDALEKSDAVACISYFLFQFGERHEKRGTRYLRFPGRGPGNRTLSVSSALHRAFSRCFSEIK